RLHPRGRHRASTPPDGEGEGRSTVQGTWEVPSAFGVKGDHGLGPKANQRSNPVRPPLSERVDVRATRLCSRGSWDPWVRRPPGGAQGSPWTPRQVEVADSRARTS